MVIDSLQHTEIYEKINPLFKIAFDYIKSTDFTIAEAGKVELHGKDLFVMVSDTKLKPEVDAMLEVHNDYIDIQIPISRSETFGWASRSDLKSEKEPFNNEKDIQFFIDKPKTFFIVNPGDFVIFWPQDGHAPCVGEGSIRKVIIKIKVNGK